MKVPAPLDLCSRCHHERYLHHEAEGWNGMEYKCWEPQHPYTNGRCGCPEFVERVEAD